MFNAERFVGYGPLGLLFVSFLESIVFPVPPDLILIPLCLAVPRLSFWYATLATVASVLGGVVGYFLGQKAGKSFSAGAPGKPNDDVEKLFTRYGGWAVGIAAFTPIPYKVFTFAAGVFRTPLHIFCIASCLGRGGRFFLEAAAVFYLGDRAQAFLGRNFEIATMTITVALFVLVILVQKSRKR